MEERKQAASGSWVREIFRFASASKGRMISAVIIELLSVTGGLLPYIGVYQIIVGFFEQTITKDRIVFWILFCVGGYTLKIWGHAIATTFSHVAAYRILEQIRLAMTRKLMKAPLGSVLSKQAGVIKSNIVDRVETIELPLAHLIPEGISNLVLPVAVFIYLLIIDWRMALASMITVPLAFTAYAIVMQTYSKKYDEYMKSSNYVNSVIVEYTEGIEVIKAFGRSGSSYEKFASAVSDFKNFTLDWYRSSWKLMNLGGAILPSTLLGVLPIGLALYLTGSLAPADLIMCMILSMGIIGPLTSFTVFVNELKAIEYGVKDARAVLHMEELPEEKDPKEINNYDVDLEQVSFAYEEKEVLHAINLHLPQGSYTALVGPSGSGKSTVARLIARFWDASKGAVKIGGVDIKSLPFDQLADCVSFVTQDNFLFNCSLRENIRLGNPEASDEQVYEAARAARCDGFIRELERGYDTDAGEAGTCLSGGEKQRIAIARAMMKNAPVVILDEATAFTDPENEAEIQKSIEALTRDKTLLVIAHRLSTIKNADCIIVLDDGKVAAAGSHQQLLAQCPLYQDMWNAHTGAKTWAAKTTESGVAEHA